jgi:hypothetical protein
MAVCFPLDPLSNQTSTFRVGKGNHTGGHRFSPPYTAPCWSSCDQVTNVERNKHQVVDCSQEWRLLIIRALEQSRNCTTEKFHLKSTITSTGHREQASKSQENSAGETPDSSIHCTSYATCLVYLGVILDYRGHSNNNPPYSKFPLKRDASTTMASTNNEDLDSELR